MINVYIDGACSNNGKEDAKAGYGIYFGKNDKRNESNTVIGKQTNNTGELTAFVRVLEILSDEINNKEEINIYIDSEYVIKCATTFGKKLSENDWKTSRNKNPPNVELVKKAYELYSNTTTVNLHHIDAHTDNTDEHSLGNKEADKLANKSIGLEECPYNTSNDILNDNDIVYIDVPYSDKDKAKQNGARWDMNAKKWYYNKTKLDKEKQDVLNELFSIVSITSSKPTLESGEKKYINVSFDKKDTAKKYGARWDSVKRSWYYTNDIGDENISKLLKI
jgi:ribonuclease HI